MRTCARRRRRDRNGGAFTTTHTFDKIGEFAPSFLVERNGNSRATMHIELVQVEQGIFHAVLAGPFELTQAQQQFIVILNEAVRGGVTKVLIDGRQITGDPTSYERFLYGAFAACATLEVLNRANAKLKFAYVIHEPLRDPKRYGETVAVQGGMDVKTFEDKNEAVKWLNAQQK